MTTEISTVVLDDGFNDEMVQELFEKKEWMKHKKFTLVKSIPQLEEFVDNAIKNGHAAVDLETSGLNSRKNKDGRSVDKIVGLCLAFNSHEGFYVPIAHEAAEYNLPEVLVMEQIKRLAENCVTIYHNFKFDGEFLRFHGIIIEDGNMYDDTLLLAYALDHGLKNKGLKGLSKARLGQEMIEIKELMSDKANVDFGAVDPEVAVFYGGSDAICTYGLWEVLMEDMAEADPKRNNGLHNIYMVEKRCQFVVMEMERNMIYADTEYFKRLNVELTERLEKMSKDMHEIAGRPFDIMSAPQIGVILFDELKVPYPSEFGKNATGGYLTNKDVLASLKGHKMVDMLIKYRELRKTLSTYVDNFVKNSDWNNQVKFKLNQSAADTGRFSASGGFGLDKDGYCGVNCQNIPSNYSADAIDIRAGMKAAPGFVFCAIDYSGEELRIATNLSGEKKWLAEFLYGSGDLHTITGRIATGKQELTKVERGLGKTVNFLTLYGGGANKLAGQADISVEEAQQILHNFFAELPGLSGWIKAEMRKAKKRGFAMTAFGRRRPLKDLYESGERMKIAQADRNSVNSAIQGTGADIIKIALYKCWRYIRDNNLEDVVRVTMPIHDEIVFEVRQDRLNDIIPALSEVMKMDSLLKGRLGWKVGLEVDCEYSTSFHVKWDFNLLKEGNQCYCCGTEVKGEGNGKIRLCSEKDVKPGKPFCYGKSDAEVLSLHGEDKPFSILHLLDGGDGMVEDNLSNTEDKPVQEAKPNLEQKSTQPSTEPEKVAGKPEPKAAKEPAPVPEKEESVKSMSFDEPANLKEDDSSTKRDSLFFDHIITKNDEIAKSQANLMWAVLDSEQMRKHGTGEKKRIRLLNPEGEVLHTTPQKFYVDGFIALALNYDI